MSALFIFVPSSPNGPGLVNWPLYDRQKQEYMELGQNQSVKQKLKKDKVDFVTAILPQMLQQMEAAAAAAKPANWASSCFIFSSGF